LKRRVVRVCENALAYNPGRQAAGKCAKHLKEAFELRVESIQTAAEPPPRGARAAECEGGPTFAQKRELLRELHDLSPLDQSRVARQLAKERPRALKPIDGREAGSSKRVRVELDELDAETFVRARELAEERARKAVEMDLQDELEEYPQ